MTTRSYQQLNTGAQTSSIRTVHTYLRFAVLHCVVLILDFFSNYYSMCF